MFDICEDFFMEENSEEEPSIRKQQKDYLFDGSKMAVAAIVLIL